MKNIMKYKFGLLLLSGVFAFAACNKEKEEDLFAGKDSYITAFSLQQGDTVFHAAIAGDEITVTVPESFSLTQAKATVKLSENATIYPDPATVTAWDEEQAFAVTAHSGVQTKYKYTVMHSGLSYDGSLALYTQADVDAFGRQGITLIDGNLTIGRAAGTDSITSLAPLAGLKEVVYNLTVNPTFAGAGLAELEVLDHVGGTLQIGAAPHLETAALPALKSAGAIVLQNTATIVVELPELAGVSKQLSLNCPLFQLRLPNLQRVGGTLTLTTSSASITSLDKVSLPALEEAGSITISAFPNVTKIDLPQLKKSGGLRCTSMSKLSLIYAPLLEEVTGSVYLTGLAALAEVELPALKQAGEIYIATCSLLRLLGFPKLTDVTTLNLQSPPVSSLAGFVSLQTAGTVTLYNLKELNKIAFPASVQRINLLTVQSLSGTPAPSEINVTGIHIGTLKLSGNATGTGKLIGDDLFGGSLFIDMINAGPYPDKLPQFEGFDEVDSLSITPQGAQKVHIRGIRKVRRGFYTGTGYSGNPYEFSISDLEEVGGNFTVWYPYMANTPATLTAVTFDKLKRVGGNFTVDITTATADSLSFPELTTVGRNFTLSSGQDLSGNYKGFEVLEFPKLTAVGGKLLIQASTSTSSRNSKLTNLDGFAALASVGSIEVTRHSALVDYEGLKELFKTLPAAGWIAPTRNSYNPSWQDLKDGKWTKP
jgi:hypothetical protein